MQQGLADLCGLPRRCTFEIENGKQPIGKQNVRKLG